MKNKKFITSKMAAKMLQVSSSTAWRRIRAAKDALGIVGALTIKSFNDYYGIDIQQLNL